MPATQTTYTESLPIGTLGQVVNMETANSISRVVEDAAGIGFAIAVFQGVNDLGVTKTPGTAFRGVTIADRTLVQTLGGTTDTYPQRSTAAILEKGPIWVAVAAAVAAGAPAAVTSGSVWTSTVSGNTAIANATFDSSTTGAGLAKLRIR